MTALCQPSAFEESLWPIKPTRLRSFSSERCRDPEAHDYPYRSKDLPSHRPGDGDTGRLWIPHPLKDARSALSPCLIRSQGGLTLAPLPRDRCFFLVSSRTLGTGRSRLVGRSGSEEAIQGALTVVAGQNTSSRLTPTRSSPRQGSD